ncbi:MAG: plasmid partitioning protein RepB [Hyphomicrobiales bacterium]|nr:plasmid partitioning protein RepB [Hyphomicrobiales bacterium]MDE2017497.1 plasmid partitioning protein RepB [Hyphomicrobiales bacterium]
MNKRSDTIRSLFAQKPADALSADNPAEAKRVPAGAVRTMKDTFSGVERENEALRAQLESGERVQEIDPGSIDPSPYADRIQDGDEAAFLALKASIEERGQEVPVLLRPHPTMSGRYQTAYGHRRIRVARELGRPIRAVVRPLDEDGLVIAQGVENSAREDLTFIERALFALRLENSGRARALVQQALTVDKAEASKLLAVARAVPDDVVRAIGKAPKAGRGRWQELGAACADASAVRRGRAAAIVAGFASLTSDERFARVLAAMKVRAAPSTDGLWEIKNSAGESLADIRASGREVRVRLVMPEEGSAFASFLKERLPALFDEFRASVAGDGPKEN